METKIRKIGNSSGIILPKALIDKYDLAEVIIEDHGDGIIIKPAKKSMFQTKMEEARKNKKAIYSEIEKQASHPEMKVFYEREAEDWDGIDTEIMD
ncbi:Antitoxin component of the MazEF toxin-antitoxin module [Aquiflexum balticum DSM 16537]|uniref:Antitoxin component of the MazEF toxin-antitoxin module n=1 Tax=Aquiflexum balticum DSM 16537 TaxID=758820 RepID=A0A1W2H4W5_9BACT|nr:AbrB/MazE/SpoVT family DNA-binding domain-containing protein [Aquiflexum balticum]SMD43997.1 Antitoxin component of the MazEF toxin-antitoxin module [Aquiflexum balticum DSM 16537]